MKAFISAYVIKTITEIKEIRQRTKMTKKVFSVLLEKLKACNRMDKESLTVYIYFLIYLDTVNCF